MKPDEPSSSQNMMSLSKQGPVNDIDEKHSQEAAALVIRSQIENLYAEQENTTTNSEISVQPQLETISPYQRTHTDTDQSSQLATDWKQYHTAWQTYYQKYYESYYTHHLEKAQQAIAPGTSNGNTLKNQNIFSKKGTSQPVTNDEAVFDLRQQLLGKVNSSATKIKKSRHFIPITSGIVVMLIFVFLQYNRVIFANVAAYVSPGSIDPQNIVIDPNANLAVGPDPLLIIPKINVSVPVIYDVGNDYNSQMAAMTKGVAHFAIPGANSRPGQIGNTVISGHSSNDWLDGGNYKFIFAQLDKLQPGDTIYVNYSSVRYTYTVTNREVVKPSEISKLVYTTTKPILTLITCTPIGTATNRLLVTAEQISPNPVALSITPTTTQNETINESIPGNSPTFIERLLGNRW